MNAKTVFLTLAVAATVAGAFFAGRQFTGPHEAAGQTATADATTEPAERKVLYYRNPMGLPDTSPVPKKDSMGMDYIPVYEGEDDGEDATGTVKLSPGKIQTLGVRTERAERRVLERTVRAVGTLQVDERGLYTLTTKYEGWIEEMYVNTTGERVIRGQPLMEVYAPEVMSTQREYLIASGGGETLGQATEEAKKGLRELATSAMIRLRGWDMSMGQVMRLRQTGQVMKTLVIESPVEGIVLEKPLVDGQRFMPGEALYKIADLSKLWLIAEVFEQDIGLVRVGQRAKFRVDAFPERDFSGRVSFIYPTLDEATRTLKLRIELPNPHGMLRPGMYGSTELATGGGRPVLAVPDSAVIDSGIRKIVLVQRDEGRFEPREVRTGRHGDGYVEVLKGISEGDEVVVQANFLIDAESNLKAALAGLKPGEAPSRTHSADATVEELDPANDTMTLTHGPIPSLKWPSMTMDFLAADKALFKGLKPGMKVKIEIEDRGEGEFYVTRIAPAGPHLPSPSGGGAGGEGATSAHPHSPKSPAKPVHEGH